MVEIEKASFDDGCDGARVDLAEGMIFAHIARDTAGVEGESRIAIITVNKTGSETVGTVRIGGTERRGNLEAGGFVVDVFA